MAKRVLIYTNHFFPEQFKINEIVDWLLEENHHVRVVTGLPNYPKGKIFKDYDNLTKNRYKKEHRLIINRLLLIPRGNGSYFMLAINYFSYFISCLYFTIYLAIFKKKYDIIFVHHTSPFFISLHPIIYSLFNKSKKIMWDLDIWPESLKAVNVIKSAFLFSIIKSFVEIIYSKYDFILVGSRPLVNVVKNRFNGRIIYFPNWADKIIEDNKIDVEDIFLMNTEKFNIVYTGNIGKAQDFESLIKTIGNVQENIHWTFVGDGRFKSQFKRLIEDNSLTTKVTFIDQVNINLIPSIANKADALFLSLKSDEIFSKTVPAKLQVYMALGKPIIGMLNGEGAKLINEADCGTVEENYNYEELAKKINSFASKTMPELIRKGHNGKNYYFKHFSSLIRKKEILNLIND